MMTETADYFLEVFRSKKPKGTNIKIDKGFHNNYMKYEL
jgi:hypothetical protein